MTYLLDREFPFGLENLLLCGKNIEEKGLQIIAQIEQNILFMVQMN